MRFRNRKGWGRAILALTLLVGIAAFILNWVTLPHEIFVQTIEVTMAFALIFVCFLTVIYFVANRKVTGETRFLRRLPFLEKITRMVGYAAVTGLIAGVLLPALREEWAPMIRLFVLAVLILIPLSFIRVFIFVYSEPYLEQIRKTEDKENPSS
jgi:hypothetical protein